MSAKKVQRIIEETQKYFLAWQQAELDQCVSRMLFLHDILLKEKDSYATLISLEMGKPIASSVAEIEKCALLCRHYVDKAAEYL